METGELEAMRQQLQSLADTLVGDFDGEHDASAALIAKASDMMLTLQATVERQAAEIAELRHDVARHMEAANGYLAERARILAAMREPDAALVEAMARGIYDATRKGASNCYSWDDAWEHNEPRRDGYLLEATAALAAAADHMEAGDAG